MDILIHPDMSNLYVRYDSCASSSPKESVIRSLTRRAHILWSHQQLKMNWTVYATCLQNNHPDRMESIKDSVKT